MIEEEITLEKIINLTAAVEVIANNQELEGNISYWLGRLGDCCASPLKHYEKERMKIARGIQKKQEPLQSEFRKLDKVKDSEKCQEINAEIQKLNEEYGEEVEKLQQLTEKIKIPSFKMSDFIAKDDTTKIEEVREAPTKEGEQPTTRKIEIKIKKGQSLVPIRFFKFMGEYIKE